MKEISSEKLFRMELLRLAGSISLPPEQERAALAFFHEKKIYTERGVWQAIKKASSKEYDAAWLAEKTGYTIEEIKEFYVN